MLSEVVVATWRKFRWLIFGSLIGIGIPQSVLGANVTLAWDQSTDPTVVGYHLYYGTSSGVYTNMTDVGNTVSAVVSNLAPSATYYFAASSYNAAGLESVYSAEASYTAPVQNVPPTLDPVADVTLNENAGPQTISLTGITSGSASENQTLTVSAFSSNPALVPNPTVTYTSPNTTGTLTFSAASNSFGLVVMTVMVDDGGATSNTLIRTFGVTIVPPPPITNLVVAPTSVVSLPLTPSFTNHDKVTYSLGPSAPAGAVVFYSKKGGPCFAWTPTMSQASSTNLITVVITDTTNPSLSTTETLRIVVTDLLDVGLGQTSLQAGQAGTLPLYLLSSEGVASATLTIGWPGANFSNPTLSLAAPSVLTNSLLNQGTNLLITLQTLSGQVLQGSNLIGQLNFQTTSNQPSAFVPLPVSVSGASKPTGVTYLNCFAQAGRVAVVSSQPLLQASSTSSNVLLTVFGNTGTKYQLQTTTNSLYPATWYAVATYMQTNVSQPITVSGANPLQLFRLLQK